MHCKLVSNVPYEVWWSRWWISEAIGGAGAVDLELSVKQELEIWSYWWIRSGFFGAFGGSGAGDMELLVEQGLEIWSYW